MIRIAICDDMPDQVSLITTLTKRYFKNKNVSDFSYKTFENPFLLVAELERNNDYDLFLLDICMPGILGTDIAREVRKHIDKCEIIFLTTSEEFAVEAFSLHAAHYLVKPFQEEQFFEAMDRVFSVILTKDDKKLVIHQNREITSVSIDDVLYVESNGHLQNVYLLDGRCLQARQSLSQFTEELMRLSRHQFVSPYKGFLVNQNQIKQFGNDKIELVNGKTVPVSRQKVNILKKQYFDYMFDD